MTQKKSHIPKIRFKEFSWEWEEKVFSSIYDFIWSNSYSRDSLNYEDWEIKNIHYWDIHTKFKSNFKIKYEGVLFINRDIDLSKITEEKYCQEWDLIIADASEDYKDIWKAIELIDLDNQKLLAWLHTFIARPKKNKVAIWFWWYLMKTFNVRYQIMIFAVWIKVLWISKVNLWLVNINLPNLKEQQKIASFLSSVDEKIEKIKEKKKNLEEYKKWVMQKIFSQEIRFKDENWEEFGEWEEKKLAEICEKQSSNISANTLETNTWNYKIYWATWFLKFIDFYQEEDDYISIVKDWAWVWRVLYCEWKSSVLGTLDKIKPKKWTNLNFLLSVLSNIDFTKYTIWSTIPHIYFKDYWKEKVNLPTLKEQEKIADFLSGIDEKIEKVSDELEKMKEFKKGLLQGMFV